MSSSTPARRDALALILAAASWGIGTVVSKRALEEVPPLTLLPIQLGASLVVLAILMRRRGLRLRADGVPPILGRLGLLNPGLAYALSLVGLVSISASLSVLLWVGEPLLILLLASVVLRERITASFVVLSLGAAAGMIIVIYDPTASGRWLGVALTLAGVACCAIYTVATRKWLGVVGSTAQIVVAQQAYALAFAVIVAAGAAILGGAVPRVGISPLGWLSAIGSGVLYYAAAYWFYLSGLRHAPASLAAVSFYLIPVFGVAGGVVLLGDRLDARQWIGVAIVLGAVGLIARSSLVAEPGPVAAPTARQGPVVDGSRGNSDNGGRN